MMILTLRTTLKWKFSHNIYIRIFIPSFLGERTMVNRYSHLGALVVALVAGGAAAGCEGGPSYPEQNDPIWIGDAIIEYRTDYNAVVGPPQEDELQYGNKEALYIEGWLEGNPDGQWITFRDPRIQKDDPILLDLEDTRYVGTWYYPDESRPELVGVEGTTPVMRVPTALVDVDVRDMISANSCVYFMCSTDSVAYQNELAEQEQQDQS